VRLAAVEAPGRRRLGAILDSIEAKVEARRHNPGTFVNRELATL
jgi:hypothetical protein